MLGTFVRNGLDQRQAESEILTTMYGRAITLPIIPYVTSH